MRKSTVVDVCFAVVVGMCMVPAAFVLDVGLRRFGCNVTATVVTVLDDTPPNTPRESDISLNTPPAVPEADLCAICLDPIDPTTTGEASAVLHPTCARHRLHLACLAQQRAQADADMHCPVCAAGGWADADDQWLRAACAARGIEAPTRLPAPSTVRQGIADYTIRTFTSNDAPEPQPPTHVRVLCCRRVAAVRGDEGEINFVELPDRRIQWSPIAVRGDTGIMAWRLSWACPRCPREPSKHGAVRSAASPGPAAARHHTPPPQNIIAAAQALPSGAELHLGWVVRQLASAEGYIHAAAQEVCLQPYGGLSFAANLDRFSDAFRRDDEAPVPPAPAGLRPAAAALGARQSDGDDGLDSPDDEAEGVAAAEQHADTGSQTPLPAGAPCTAAAAPTQAEQRVGVVSTGVRLGLEQLDDIDLAFELRRRTLTLQITPERSDPTSRHSPLCAADGVGAGRGGPRAGRHNPWLETLFLAPRASNPPSSSGVRTLSAAAWPSLLRAACAAPPARPTPRSPADGADPERRAARATALVHLGELSAASRALTAEPLAAGNQSTLAELRDPSRRPQTPVVPLSPEVLNHVAEPCIHARHAPAGQPARGPARLGRRPFRHD
ncbi:unnamed protein product [Symbiodinium sp. CCMP2592]|nr:unnamed protein product [Symbiodinium sp. CCMP2592]